MDGRTNANFMAISNRSLCLKRPVHDIASDVVQGWMIASGSGSERLDSEIHTSFLILAREIVVKGVMRAVRAVVETISKGIRLTIVR